MKYAEQNNVFSSLVLSSDFYAFIQRKNFRKGVFQGNALFIFTVVQTFVYLLFWFVWYVNQGHQINKNKFIHLTQCKFIGSFSLE